MVALDYFRRLGHDNHRRLSKLYAWEEKKSKASLGAQIVDYEKIAGAAAQAMKAADLNRFLVICALVPDLYCPGYNPRQSLETKSPNQSRRNRIKQSGPTRLLSLYGCRKCEKRGKNQQHTRSP
jgi:hypothetical protein